MKKVVEYKTNLSKKELKDLMKEVILEKYKEDYSKMIAIAQMYEEELKNDNKE